MGQKLWEIFDYLAETIVGWEVERLGNLLSWLVYEVLLNNLDALLPFAGLIALFVFKPTRWFALGSLILGLLLL